MDATTRNKVIINKYKQLVAANYKESGTNSMHQGCVTGTTAKRRRDFVEESVNTEA